MFDYLSVLFDLVDEFSLSILRMKELTCIVVDDTSHTASLDENATTEEYANACSLVGHQSRINVLSCLVYDEIVKLEQLGNDFSNLYRDLSNVVSKENKSERRIDSLHGKGEKE